MCIRDREEIVLLEYPVVPMQFVIEVEKGNAEYQLFYSEEGGFIADNTSEAGRAKNKRVEIFITNDEY